MSIWSTSGPHNLKTVWPRLAKFGSLLEESKDYMFTKFGFNRLRNEVVINVQSSGIPGFWTIMSQVFL